MFCSHDRNLESRSVAALQMEVDSCRGFVIYFHCFGNMKISVAVDSLGALAQETRLNIFRLLVRHAPNGLPAGAIARRLNLPGPTLSFHLNALAATELVRAHKNGRSITYSANLESVNRLTNFLLENCCGGRGGCEFPVEAQPVGRGRALQSATSAALRRR